MTLYRIYIDEVGNHDMNPNSVNTNERFLTLFGVIIERNYMLHTLQPEMDLIKRDIFNPDPDEPIIFHRKDITKKRGQFSKLGDAGIRHTFGNRMLQAYKEWQYTTIIVTIDKQQHLRRYGVHHQPPYPYCLKILMERYILFLKSSQAQGDVMIEARGKDVDRELAQAYQNIFLTGSSTIRKEVWQTHLTTYNLKIHPKTKNIAGLQLADLLAHPAHYNHLMDHQLISRQESEYGQEVVNILNQLKYYRSIKGEITGYGKKMLP